MKDQWFVSCQEMADKAIEVGAFLYISHSCTFCAKYFKFTFSNSYEFFHVLCHELSTYAQTAMLIVILQVNRGSLVAS